MAAVVVVHGGAWSVPDQLAKAVVDGVKMAALDGFSVLKGGGSALDAVEAAVRNLEDNLVFNAGINYQSIKYQFKDKKTPDRTSAHWLHLLAAMTTFT